MVDSIKVEIKLTVEQMSKTFASMGCEEQASFFTQAWKHLEESCGDEVYREQQCSFIREALAKQPEAQAFLAELREPETDRKKIALEYRQWDLADSTPLEDIRKYKMEMANCRCVPFTDTLAANVRSICIACGAKPIEGHDEKCPVRIAATFGFDPSQFHSAEKKTGGVYINSEACGSFTKGPATKWKTVTPGSEVSAPSGDTCPDCDGTGEVELLTSFVECERCQK